METRYVRLNEVQYAATKARAAELLAQGFVLAPLEEEKEKKTPPPDDDAA